MVSFQEFDLINLEKKRRWEDRSFEGEESLEKEWKFTKILKTKSLFDDIKFHDELERSSTLDASKKCFDIQQGEVLYNSKNQKITNTNKDPKRFLEMGPMSLDLELNLLPYDSPRPTQAVDDENSSSTTKHGLAGNNMTTSVKNSKCSTPFSKDTDRQLMKNSDAIRRCPSWMSLEADQQEMVAAACMQCHMLVMLCKSSPACPNCKFMHPPGHQGSINNLFKPRFSTTTTTLSWKN